MRAREAYFWYTDDPYALGWRFHGLYERQNELLNGNQTKP